MNQPFDGINYEIVCIDDCSTDSTYEVLISLAKQYKQIRVLKNKQNKGVSYTRNRMIDEALGKYIWFVACSKGAQVVIRKISSLAECAPPKG